MRWGYRGTGLYVFLGFPSYPRSPRERTCLPLCGAGEIDSSATILKDAERPRRSLPRGAWERVRSILFLGILLTVGGWSAPSEARIFRQIMRAPLQLLGFNLRPMRSQDASAPPRTTVVTSKAATATPVIPQPHPISLEGFTSPQLAFEAHIAGFVRQDHGALYAVLAPDLRDPFLFVLLAEAFEERSPALRKDLRTVLREHCVDETRFVALDDSVSEPANNEALNGGGANATASNDLKLPAGWTAVSEQIQDKPALVRKLMDVYWRRDQATMNAAARRALPQQLAHGRQLKLELVRAEDDWAVGTIRDPAPLPVADSVVAFPKRMLFKKVNDRWYVEDTRVGE